MPVTCKHCGAAFEARRSTARFCSTLCRVRANRVAIRREVLRRQNGRCAYAPLLRERDDDLEDIDLDDLGEPDGPCEGALVILARRVAVCHRHKGQLGERGFASKFEPERYHAIRRQQGRECRGNSLFHARVAAFVRS